MTISIASPFLDLLSRRSCNTPSEEDPPRETKEITPGATLRERYATVGRDRGHRGGEARGGEIPFGGLRFLRQTSHRESRLRPERSLVFYAGRTCSLCVLHCHSREGCFRGSGQRPSFRVTRGIRPRSEHLFTRERNGVPDRFTRVRRP